MIQYRCTINPATFIRRQIHTIVTNKPIIQDIRDTQVSNTRMDIQITATVSIHNKATAVILAKMVDMAMAVAIIEIFSFSLSHHDVLHDSLYIIPHIF